MFYSAIAQLDVTRKIDFLDHQGDQSYWNIIELCDGLSLHFALLNQNTDPMGRIISALTESAVYHVEAAVGDKAPDDVKKIAESLLGLPYDFYGALRAWDNGGKHTDDKEFCSGMCEKIVSPVIFGLQAYPNPGRLLMEVCTAKGLPQPKLGPPQPSLTDREMDYLDSLHEQGQISCGTMQEVLAVAGGCN